MKLLTTLMIHKIASTKVDKYINIFRLDETLNVNALYVLYLDGEKCLLSN